MGYLFDGHINNNMRIQPTTNGVVSGNVFVGNHEFYHIIPSL
jgi:hypothetical protein